MPSLEKRMPSGNVPSGKSSFGNGNGGIASSSSLLMPWTMSATDPSPISSAMTSRNEPTYSSAL